MKKIQHLRSKFSIAEILTCWPLKSTTENIKHLIHSAEVHLTAANDIQQYSTQEREYWYDKKKKQQQMKQEREAENHQVGKHVVCINHCNGQALP